MSRARVHENRVNRSGIVSGRIAGDYFDLAERSEVRSSAIGEMGVEFDCRDSTALRDQMSDEGRVASGSAPDMHDVFARLDVHGVKPKREDTRQSAIETTILVQRH
jgi:hypothetical protein